MTWFLFLSPLPLSFSFLPLEYPIGYVLRLTSFSSRVPCMLEIWLMFLRYFSSFEILPSLSIGTIPQLLQPSLIFPQPFTYVPFLWLLSSLYPIGVVY